MSWFAPCRFRLYPFFTNSFIKSLVFICRPPSLILYALNACLSMPSDVFLQIICRRRFLPAGNIVPDQRWISGLFYFILRIYLTIEPYYAKIRHKENTAFYRRERKKAPAETLRWHSTSPNVYVLKTHKHPPESRRRRWLDYNTSLNRFQAVSVKTRDFFESFLGIF